MSGSNSNATNTPANRNKFHSPPVELPSSNAQNFFEEAKIGQAEENELRRKFGKFCSKAPPVAEAEEAETYLTIDDFCRMLQYYECAGAQNYEAYFHAIDRNRDDRLDFQEFFLGCCAADPSTVHILNSFTGYERSQYIFDFYDTNRSNTLEFDEFSRLTADCLSLPTTNPSDDQVRHNAIEKARDLGALEETGPGLSHFTCIKFKKFYEFIQNERLRGTSRLFRFYKSIIKSRGGHHGRRAQGSSVSSGAAAGASTSTTASTPGGASTATSSVSTSHGHGSGSHTPGGHSTGGHAAHAADDTDEDPPSDQEDCEWHANLLDLDAQFDPDGDEPPAHCQMPPLDRPSPPPYNALLPPAPAPSMRTEPEPSSCDARTIAKKVLQALKAPSFDGLLPGPGDSPEGDTPFLLATPAQIRSLCNAAVRLFEPEDMVLTGLQPPVKVFGALHGQLFDLLSYFKWHQAPVEGDRDGDILYTTYVFLGDYADRGAYGLEVLTLLLSLKVATPHRVVLLRGQHESRHVNYHFGLRLECERRLGVVEGMKVYEHLNRAFEYMSLAAIIGGQILALSPGVLPSSLTRIEHLRRYKKPLALSHASQPRPAQPLDRLNEQALLEMFTPAPLMSREFGVVREANAEQVKSFCSQHKLACVVRSRVIPTKGFSFECGGQLISITSCTDYCDIPGGNDAAILCIAKDESGTALKIRPKVLTARVAKVYTVLGRAQRRGTNEARTSSDPGSTELVAVPRWPTQVRSATPGRVVPPSRLQDNDGGADGIVNASSLSVQLQDRSVTPDSAAPPVRFPAFGPGRPPGGLLPKDRDAPMGFRSGGDSPSQRASVDGRDGQAFSNSISTNGEDWSLLTAGSGCRTFPERRSLGPRRSSGSGTKTLHDSHQDPKRPSGAAVAGSVEGTAAHRRSAQSPTSEASSTGPSTGGTAGREARAATTGAGTPTGRSTPAGGGVPSGPHDRRNGGNGRAKESLQLRGPSRPPGAASSPKAAAASTSSGNGSRALRRGSSDSSAPCAAPPSPRRHHGEDGECSDRGLSSPPSDPSSLGRVLQDSPLLQISALPSAPAPFLQTPRASDQPLVLHLCRLWVEAGLSDKEWAQALQMFEQELRSQLPQARGGAGIGEGFQPQTECRWTLETFSMWLLKRQRLLRECSQWFRAFDFDQDEMVGIADFLQGLVASAAPRSAGPGTTGGLCTALAFFRLLDLEKRQSIEAGEFETILADVQVTLGTDFQFTMAQVAQRATDFEFFRSSLLPRLQATSSLRLRAFGGIASTAD